METLTFYDFKAKKKFSTDNYKIVDKSKRRFAIAEAPSGSKSYRLVKKN